MQNDFSTNLQKSEQDINRQTQELKTHQQREAVLVKEIPELEQEIQQLKKIIAENEKKLHEDERKLALDKREETPLHLKVKGLENTLRQKHAEFDQTKHRLSQLALNQKR